MNTSIDLEHHGLTKPAFLGGEACIIACGMELNCQAENFMCRFCFAFLN